jgi:outer membrane lipoprotein-sorting protein
MKRFCGHLGAIALLGVASAIGYAQSTERPDILNKVVAASKKLRYSGIRKVHMKFGPDVVQHTEYILKDGMKTRISFPDEGSFRGQIIVETENERRHYFPDRNQIEIMPPRREEYFMRIGRLGGGKSPVKYLVESGEEVAGQNSKRVSMISSSNRPFMKMWIDPNTGLVLKRVVYDREGNPQATSEFVKVDYRPSFKKSDFELNLRGAKVVTPRDRLQEMVQRGGFQSVAFSPKDPYKLESVRIQRIENVSALVQVYVKSDGRVSLYQVKAAIDPSRLKPRGRGTRYSTYSWTRGEASFVLVGELPEAKLRELATKLGG